jgi:hypothetical protein
VTYEEMTNEELVELLIRSVEDLGKGVEGSALTIVDCKDEILERMGGSDE